MRTIKTIPQLRQQIARKKRSGQTIGFVPTMGSLHAGHLSLVQKARKETDCVVVSIFVNPMQFNNKTDFNRYPRQRKQDAAFLKRAGCDLLFCPTQKSLFPANFQTAVLIKQLSLPLEGKFRPGHFDGVTTIVTKLFNLVEPTHAYFGQKDAQQARIVQQLVQDLNFPIKIRIGRTIRESNGLAMSSRNQRLSRRARTAAAAFSDALQVGKRLIQCGERRGKVVSRRMKEKNQQTSGIRWEYAEVVDPITLKPIQTIRSTVWLLVAGQVGSIRLIDGRVVRPRTTKLVRKRIRRV